MRFYTEIAKYYDDIFKTNKAQIDFIHERLSPPPKKVIDLATGTGSLALKLADLGYSVTGVDLNPAMIEIAQTKANGRAHFSVQDMLTFKNPECDAVICVGNSLVHLKDFEEIQTFLTNCKNNLTHNGILIMQIINYDRILKYNVTNLPAISNPEADLSFVREYHYDEDANRIVFTARLTVPGRTLTNTVSLYPLTSQELLQALKKALFREIHLYGDFQGNPYNPNTSFALVIAAK